MASPTRKTRLARQTKKANKGKRRKKVANKKGTTPKFKIHV
jgi:hypothetical protein